MRKNLFVLMAGLLLMTTACSNHKGEVTEFAKKVSQYARDNQGDSLAAFYPGLDSLKVTLAPVNDSVSVEEIPDAEGMYRVKLGDATLVVKRSEDGKMSIHESYGLFTFDDEAKTEARARGQYVDTLPDLENARRMADVDFLQYFEQLRNDQENVPNPLKLGKYRITKDIQVAIEIGQGCIAVTNTSDEAVPGSYYRLSYRMHHVPQVEPDWIENMEENGKDIPAHGTVTYNMDWGDRHYPLDDSFRILWSPPVKTYQPTGKEYDQYLDNKKK